MAQTVGKSKHHAVWFHELKRPLCEVGDGIGFARQDHHIRRLMQRGFNGEFFARKEESARINIKTLMSLYPKTFYHLQGTALTSHMEVNLCACAGEVGGHHASDGADAQNGNTHFNTSLIT